MLNDILPGAPGLHLTFAHLTGVGSFPTWTQQAFQMLIDAYQFGGVLRDLELDLYVDVAAVINQNPSVCNTDGSVCQIPSVTSGDLAAMSELLTAWGYDRALWGSDLDTNGFESCVDLWPGTADEFNEMAGANGIGFREN